MDAFPIIAKSPLSAGLPLLLKSYIMHSNMFAVVVLSAVALTESGRSRVWMPSSCNSRGRGISVNA